MFWRPKSLTLIASGIALTIAVPIFANDSEAETSLGGLVLKQNNQISMDSEDLYISAKHVRVKYRYTNHSNRDVKALVAFPLPPQPNMEDYFEGNYSDWQGLKFKTLVDGKPVTLTMHERIEVDGKDVSARLKQLGLPLRWFEDYEWLEKLQKMDVAKLRAWMDEGLVTVSDGDNVEWMPRWQSVTEISREQTFPAGKTVTVEHSYAPFIGGSAGGGLQKEARENWDESNNFYKDQWCVDDFFLRGFDRRHAAAQGDRQYGYYSETWIGYILSSGANWRGPIKDFRLVVDKGSPDNLVSFCMDGAKKISPTQFEVRRKNFEPEKDLNILIVQWPEVAED